MGSQPSSEINLLSDGNIQDVKKTFFEKEFGFVESVELYSFNNQYILFIGEDHLVNENGSQNNIVDTIFEFTQQFEYKIPIIVEFDIHLNYKKKLSGGSNEESEEINNPLHYLVRMKDLNTENYKMKFNSFRDSDLIQSLWKIIYSETREIEISFNTMISELKGSLEQLYHFIRAEYYKSIVDNNLLPSNIFILFLEFKSRMNYYINAFIALNDDDPNALTFIKQNEIDSYLLFNPKIDNSFNEFTRVETLKRIRDDESSNHLHMLTMSDEKHLYFNNFIRNIYKEDMIEIITFLLQRFENEYMNMCEIVTLFLVNKYNLPFNIAVGGFAHFSNFKDLIKRAQLNYDSHINELEKLQLSWDDSMPEKIE